jgi:hypothetical protein
MVRKPKPTAQGPPEDLEHISSIVRRVMDEVTVLTSATSTSISGTIENSTLEARVDDD